MIRTTPSLVLLAFAIAGCSEDTAAPTGVEAEARGAVAATLAGTWTRLPDAPADVFGASTASITNPATLSSKLYLIGGKNARFAGPGRYTDAVRVYDVRARTWRKAAALPIRLYQANNAVEIGGKIYISGGLTRAWDEQQGVWRNDPVSSLYVYDPAADRWTRKRDMPAETFGGVSAAFQGSLYVAAPCAFQHPDCPGFTSALWRYEPPRDRWTLLGRTPHGADGPGGGFIGGKLYLVSTTGALDIYDPTTGTWSSGPPGFSTFCSFPSTTFQAKLYLLDCSEDGDDAMLVFDPAANAWTKAMARPEVDDVGPLTRVFLNGRPHLQMVGGERPSNNWLFSP